MASRVSPTKEPIKRKKREDEPKYLKWLREQPCVVCGLRACMYGFVLCVVEAAHGKRGKGMGKKGPDKDALPLCGKHHRLCRMAHEKVSEPRFEGHHKVSMDCARAEHRRAYEAGEKPDRSKWVD